MSNLIFGYSGSSYGLPTLYPARSASDVSSLRYATSDPLIANVDSSSSMFLNQYAAADTAATRASAATTTPLYSSQTLWSGLDAAPGVKRSSDALYHQNVLGTHNTMGPTEAFFSTDNLAKRSRMEIAVTLPIYPQRPGERDCAHYMLTRTCKFGDSCKFDHPLWVPEGGIPDWKEVPLATTGESLPERPGEPDCPYFLKTLKCKFGFRCKFNHPKDKLNSLGAEEDISLLPERPSEPPCSFYMKTGKCKFGGACKFHHPKDIQIPLTGYGEKVEAVDDGKMTGEAKPFVPVTPALLHNSKGLPIRPGEVDCPFYIKTGSCKYGVSCRYNHPDRNTFYSHTAATLGHALITSPAASFNIGVLNPATSILPAIDPRLTQTTLGMGPAVYPQRPGQIECDYYMKTGECKFGERCKFHHPVDRLAPTPSMVKHTPQPNVKLTLAGLPRREGAVSCPFYMKTGTCKYGITCRFDHPPPGEAIAMASAQGTSDSVDGEEDNEADSTHDGER